MVKFKCHTVTYITSVALLVMDFTATQLFRIIGVLGRALVSDHKEKLVQNLEQMFGCICKYSMGKPELHLSLV